jgi:hypothetical protein
VRVCSFSRHAVPEPLTSILSPAARGEAAEASGSLRNVSYINGFCGVVGLLGAQCEEPRKDFFAVMGKHGLGMELHSVHGEFAMAERHDFSVVAFCSDFERAGQ